MRKRTILYMVFWLIWGISLIATLIARENIVSAIAKDYREQGIDKIAYWMEFPILMVVLILAFSCLLVGLVFL